MTPRERVSVAEDYQRQSPLDHLHLAARGGGALGGAAVRMTEQRFRGKINLRGAATPAFGDAVAAAIGLRPATESGTVAEADGRLALWIGPSEWLVVTPPGAGPETAASLRAALAECGAAVTDVSESLAAITVSGANARHVLAKGTSLDLHPRAFTPGRCARAGLAKTVVLLHQTDGEPAYDLYVDRSYAEYLWLWLEDAAQSMLGVPA